MSVGVEHELGGRVRVVEGERRVVAERERGGGRVGVMEGDDVDAVVVIFDEAAEGDFVERGGERREGHGVDGEGGVVGYGVLGCEGGFLSRVFHC